MIFWLDKWLDGYTILQELAPNIPPHMLTWQVCVVVATDGHWNLEFLESLLPLNSINRIKAHPLNLLVMVRA